MYLLSIFNTGGVTLALTLFAIVVSGILFYQVWKAQKSGNVQQGGPGQMPVESAENIPFYKMPKFWMGVAVWVLYLIVMVFVVAPDYKGV